ncbi:hypothetical protein GLOIN_2v1513875 [Rhizophagus irregularis DAOM 181602=DAOM 197198]|uniref:Uncharacterized protein n=1 Tax=Rhizophagus irregularis (strain DAOM 181602 / DAOM 197198 / MUCL 43194) TaxID=747089 RepID=A0A2P4QSF3_RHIID|nr:hypothetical protein GLOIN_2v1513875 [Rhizophagus irregularis DAOM 181602=DAOM 197198]POG80584.1 hypothetical protein GLOIN_2v1513875 [Rhizophagus irregularis DAOM 181602=DAOM 197198]|eukprot:XP_025187450.1 hypothetical protein GLOIN_2v1513875 [Rhizophagus irregularis DAOM 181602=DAOM 197198]
MFYALLWLVIMKRLYHLFFFIFTAYSKNRIFFVKQSYLSLLYILYITFYLRRCVRK